MTTKNKLNKAEGKEDYKGRVTRALMKERDSVGKAFVPYPWPTKGF